MEVSNDDELNEVISIKGKKLFDFTSFQDWVNTAQRKFGAMHPQTSYYLCVDTQGNVCKKGKEFQTARDNGWFPVTVYQTINL